MRSHTRRGAEGLALAFILTLAITRSGHKSGSTDQRPLPEARSEITAKSKSSINPKVFTERSDTTTPKSAPASDKEPPISPEVFSEFARWCDLYNSSEVPSDDLERAGEILAENRRIALAELIQRNPEEALRLAVPYEVRKKLPQSIVDHLEERISGEARYEVIASLPDANVNQSAAITRYVTLDDRTFRAYVYGRRLAQTTKDNIPLYGIAVDNSIAVAEHPVRVLGAVEAADLSTSAAASDKSCPISGAPGEQTYAAEVGSKVEYFCHSAHIDTLNAAIEKSEANQQPLTRQSSLKAQSADSTHGEKTLLFIRVAFPDAPEESISVEGAQKLIEGANVFFKKNSYGEFALRVTVTPLITLPHPQSWYLQWRDADARFRWIVPDARQAASAANFNPDQFDLDCVHATVVDARAFIGAKGATLFNDSVSKACHELGHNLGLFHANGWRTTDSSIIGPGVNGEYDDPFDPMGSPQERAPYSYNAYNKSLLGWLPPSAIQTVQVDGTYRLYSSAVPSLESGRTYALRIVKDFQREYWLETRDFTGRGFAGDVTLTWAPWSQSNGGTQLLDTTRIPNGGYYDAQLPFGRAFHDTDLGLKIVATRRDEIAHEWVEVVVQHVHYIAADDEGISALSQSGATIDAEIAAAGDYYLWGRTVGPATTVSVVIDGLESAGTASIAGSTKARWTRIVDASGIAKTLTLSAGTHSLQINPGDALTRIDALLVTDDPGDQFPPIFLRIPDQEILAGQTAMIPLSEILAGNRLDLMKIKATSSNNSLLSTEKITLDGDPQARSLIIKPNEDLLSSTIITLTAISEDGFSATTSFKLSVLANEPGAHLGSARLNMHVGPNGEVIFTLEGGSESNWIIQASSDFINWENIAVLPPNQTSAHVTDPYWDFPGMRVYRALRY